MIESFILINNSIQFLIFYIETNPFQYIAKRRSDFHVYSTLFTNSIQPAPPYKYMQNGVSKGDLSV